MRLLGHGSQRKKVGLSTLGLGRVDALGRGVQLIRILFTSVVKIEWEIERQIEGVSVMMQTLKQSFVVKKELRHRVKLSFYWSFDIPTLTYIQKLWIVTE